MLIKLINKAVEKLKKECGILEYSKGHWIVSGKIVVNKYAIDFLTKCIQESYKAGFSKAVKIVRENNNIAKDEEECGWTKHCTCLAHSLYCLEKELQSLTKQSKEDKTND
jgi:hypothetical protein